MKFYSSHKFDQLLIAQEERDDINGSKSDRPLKANFVSLCFDQMSFAGPVFPNYFSRILLKTQAESVFSIFCFVKVAK